MVGISLIRGINVGGHNMVRMEALRGLHESCGLTCVQTYVQSGNVVFQTRLRDLKTIGCRIEDAIEKSHGFRPSVVMRTADELRDVAARNPFAGRKDVPPNKLIVTFLLGEPDAAGAERLRAIKAAPEEFHLSGRELYIYFPEGMGRSKLPALIDKAIKIPGTARNWNTVMALLEMAAKLE
jgi:uncharacterized protein (DUF1697 family)